MNKLIPLISLACLLPLEPTQAAPVTWDFIATSCGPIVSLPSCNPAQQYPLMVATLTLDGPDSSGVAAETSPVAGSVLTASGDPFAFDLVAAGAFGTGKSMVSTAEPRGPVAGWVVDYGISWTEVAGVLTAVDISIDTIQDSLEQFGLTGGNVASDFTLAGCDELRPCQINGYWTDVPLVTAPEPGSLALLASAFGVWGLIGRRCTRLT